MCLTCILGGNTLWKNSINLSEKICENWTQDDIEKLSVDVAKVGLGAEIKKEKVFLYCKRALKYCKKNFIRKRVS